MEVMRLLSIPTVGFLCYHDLKRLVGHCRVEETGCVELLVPRFAVSCVETPKTSLNDGVCLCDYDGFH